MLQGSPSRDTFKRVHKSFGAGYYALDLDLVLVEKFPLAGIIAGIDFKKPFDTVSFTEVIGYNSFLRIAPLYVIRADNPETGPYTIDRYLGGDWRPDPPVPQTERVTICETLEDLRDWESGLRQAWRRQPRSPQP